MTKQTIEVEGLPEGWKAVAYRNPKRNERYFHQGIIWTAHIDEAQPFLIVEKIQPRRIVLEETVQGKHERAFFDDNNMWTYWREVKETDASLNSGDPKLSLSVDEVKELTSQIWPKDIIYKVNKFIKENS